MRFLNLSSNSIFLLLACLLFSCHQTQEEKRFHYLNPEQTGIDFQNIITETPDFNILNFHYIYNGGGVGVGDFNKDGLADLVFSGNEVSSKIYLNKGNLTFEDISETANFQTSAWVTGVSIIDINSDGWDDIYLSVGGLNCENNCKNLLFVNQGIDAKKKPTFVERAADFNLDDGLYTQQTLFFDYDNDDDLDAYLLHNVIDPRDKNAPSQKRFISEKSKDQLMRNDGTHFVNVSDSLGILHRGYGLGITLSDFNNDQLPDLYIANDFLSDDLMYLNLGNKKGKHQGFEEVSKRYLKHQSYNSMGVDVADINNDATPDILVLDMMPAYHERQKNMMGFMNYDKFLLTLKQGYAPQFVHNALQVHNGFLNEELLPFSEVGYLTGLYNTDWSWTPLIADFDNDGDRDVYVTNGYGKDITDLDFINFSNQAGGFGTKEDAQKRLYESVRAMKEVSMPNYFFENKGQLKFEDQSEAWISPISSISNGAVYVDLDQDGDLDLVSNNINQTAFLLENRTTKTNNYLKIQLKGSKNNPSGIGSKIQIWSENKEQIHFQSPVRGYLSTVTSIAHFGLGDKKVIDSLKITWSNGLVERQYNIPSNQILNLNIQNAKSPIRISLKSNETLFEEVQVFDYEQQENPYHDYIAQALLLHQHSRQGPCLASANIDGKAGDELFVGGAKGFPSKIFYQRADMSWYSRDLPDAQCEDTDALFFDFEQDGDLDLYVVSGGSEYLPNAPELRDRLYLNDGKGNFLKKEDLILPSSSGSCVRPRNFNEKGKIDLFVGGRLVPKAFPQAPQSSFLVKEKNRYLDQTNTIEATLSSCGMITDALWVDYDSNGWEDLIVVGEWMPITIFKNEKTQFQKIEIPFTRGLWNSVAVGDFDKDGDIDLLVGNLGQNTRLQATPDEPLTLLKIDYDNNGSPDPLIGQFYQNKKGERKSYPIHSRDDVMRQLVKMKKRYIKYSDFGEASFPEIIQSDLAANNQLVVNCLASSWIENKGNDEFVIKPLPTEVQYAPIQDVLVQDFNEDGHLDALLVGNDFSAEKNGGWQDALNGLYLKGDGNGGFEAITSSKSGFLVEGDGRAIIALKDRSGEKLIVVGQNSGKLKFFKQ